MVSWHNFELLVNVYIAGTTASNRPAWALTQPAPLSLLMRYSWPCTHIGGISTEDLIAPWRAAHIDLPRITTQHLGSAILQPGHLDFIERGTVVANVPRTRRIGIHWRGVQPGWACIETPKKVAWPSCWSPD
jgi:hypothetical protein